MCVHISRLASALQVVLARAETAAFDLLMHKRQSQRGGSKCDRKMLLCIRAALLLHLVESPVKVDDLPSNKTVS